MVSQSPISEGLRRACREPAIVLAEIAWRWSFGLAALALAAGTLFAYLDTIPVSKTELLALRSGVPWLMIDAIAHILRGSGSRLVRAVTMVFPAMAILWIAAATPGRLATLKALFGREDRLPPAPQFVLNLLRASVTLAWLAGCVGTAILAGWVASGDRHVRPGIFLLVFIVLGTTITMLRAGVNWFFSLGAIPAVSGGHDTFGAISEAVGLFSRHAAKFAGVGALLGTVHGVLFVFTTAVCLLVLSLAGKLPLAATLLLLAAISLGYFAAVDFLHIARLAAYIAIDESDRTPPPAAVALKPLPPEPSLPAPDPLVET